MSEDHVWLEHELAALKPVTPSPALESQIEAELSVQPADGATHRGIRYVALAGGLALVALFALTIVRRLPDGSEPPVPVPDNSLPAVAALDQSLPSVWAYRQAVVDSAVDFDELLDRHRGAGRLESPGQQHAFPVSSLTQDSRMGDL
jgi:hypothetical protein